MCDGSGARCPQRPAASPLATETPSHPGAAGSLREGMEETLTLTHLGIGSSLKRTLESTNPCESMIECERGGLYPRHCLTITPGPPSRRFHDERDILRVRVRSSCDRRRQGVPHAERPGALHREGSGFVRAPEGC